VKLVPTPEEVSQMQQYEGDVNDLAECEKFFYQFVKIENIVERLQMWSYKMTFEEVYSDHKKKVDLIHDTTKSIRESKSFKQTLATILAIGNYINGGSNNGQQHGFTIQTLEQIGDFKTADNNMSILGYLYLFLRKQYPNALNWVEEFKDLPATVRIESDNLNTEIGNMEKDLNKLKELISNTENEEKKRWKC